MTNSDRARATRPKSSSRSAAHPESSPGAAPAPSHGLAQARSSPAPPCLFLVRHAKAGSRERFEGPDLSRPISPRGREQALEIARTLRATPRPIRRLLSSPAMRCRQTVDPLAEVARLQVEEVDWLAEAADPDHAFELLGRLTADTDPPDASGGPLVACTHGDVVWGVIDGLVRIGVDIGEPDAPKGGIWMIRFGAGGKARSGRAASRAVSGAGQVLEARLLLPSEDS